MKIAVDNEFLSICKNIIQENKDIEDWRLVEADDYFISENYEGGFDATEDAFCFSYYDFNKQEWWFQLTLEEVDQVLTREMKEILIRPRD